MQTEIIKQSREDIKILQIFQDIGLWEGARGLEKGVGSSTVQNTGDWTGCKNNRGISLLNVAGKV